MNITASDVLGALFEPADIVNFRVFDDKKTGVFQGLNLACECGKFKTLEPKLHDHNAKGRGVFFVVNYGGQTDESILRINAQFVEMDNASFEEQQKRIDSFPLPPSMIIQTQKSLHVYWFMDSTAEVKRFRGIQKQLVKHFDGDPACVNESRVMRLPGFMHCKKDPPVEVTCLSFHPERKYTQNQLAELLPEVDSIPVERRCGTEKGIDRVMKECLFMQHCRDDAATLSESEWYSMITNLATFEGGTEMIHKLSAPYPGYDKNATQRKINHFLDSHTKPMNCSTIYEKGFQCPKYTAQECPVKSPAAWSYQPMSSEELVSVIHSLPVPDSEIDKVKSAQEYVRDYLYNQDMVLADVIINSELKTHFDLKMPQLKLLTKVYREVSKKYQASKERYNSRLPEWYMVSNLGFIFMPGVLAEHLAKEQHVFYAAEQYFIYRNGVYAEMSEMEAQRLVQEKLLTIDSRMSQITDAEKQWRLQVQRDIRELNANPYIINVRNGLYNVLEDKLVDHTPDYYSTVQLEVSYNKDADCPRFKKFLMESMGGNMEQVALIQEILGYFLIPVTSAQKCFLLVGVASAGKSVLLRVLNEVLLGRKNVSNVSWQSLNERFKTAELFGKLANIFADLPTKNLDDNGIFKALVGEDYLTVEKKNRDPFAFQSSARLIFSCNNIPRNYGDRSEGFYRRLLIIRFDNAVPEEKRDPELLDKFRLEADGIFLFALEGLRRLVNNHYRFSETEINKAELQRYREESDSGLSFIRECCELDPTYKAGSTELYNAYRKYCDDSGLKPYSQKAFVQQLTAQPGITRSKDSLSSRRILTGIRLGDVLG